MNYGNWIFFAFRVEFNLSEAADISSGDEVGSGGVEIGYFSLAEDIGRIRMFYICLLYTSDAADE